MKINRPLCKCLWLSLLICTSCTDSNSESSQYLTGSDDYETEVTPLSEINIKGKWKSTDNHLYPVIEFKGKSTVVVNNFLMPFVTSYERDEEFIRVKSESDKSDLLFEIISEDSIVGSGFTKGTWVKEI